MMKDEAMLSVLSMCFAPVEEAEWKQASTGAAWSDFLDAARCAMQDDRAFGETPSPIANARRRCPLQEFLSVGEVNALFRPPTYQEKRAFAARHFVGGLPESALPVESLYRPWTSAAGSSPFLRNTGGLYWGDSALYMRDLIERLGFQVPPEFSACPDHLALELDLAATLLRFDMRDEARLFLVERLGWLTAYRLRLLSLEDDASFYIGLIDVLMGIWAQVSPTEMSA
ncbi:MULTISPECIES: molecular chaperone TorD family protein [unclassified Paraeggerthella]|uniref:molecular chaperone TorD family protein n=1 Tax=unclassified Paraeggerthella TaxID=2641972 RepID=UPI001CE492B9|nr:molecular chaperone TorD family protein [Paraeggerthella sp. Marseille-Q4926]